MERAGADVVKVLIAFIAGFSFKSLKMRVTMYSYRIKSFNGVRFNGDTPLSLAVELVTCPFSGNYIIHVINV